jgi:hypothetical protein
MALLKKFNKITAILIVFLFIGGNVAYANDSSNIDLVEPNQVEANVIDTNKGELSNGISIKPVNGEISTSEIRKTEQLPVAMGSPSGSVLTNSQATKVVKRFGYRDVHEFKTELLRYEVDKTISHYNVFQSNGTKTGSARGDIYLRHTRSNTFYITGYNAYADGPTPLPI